MLQELTCDVLMPACSAALCGLERSGEGLCLLQANLKCPNEADKALPRSDTFHTSAERAGMSAFYGNSGNSRTAFFSPESLSGSLKAVYFDPAS